MRARTAGLLSFLLILSVGISAFLLVQFISMRSDLENVRTYIETDRHAMRLLLTRGVDTRVSDLELSLSEVDGRLTVIENCLDEGLYVFVDISDSESLRSVGEGFTDDCR